MKVIFLKNVKGRGVIGQVKEVSDGYAQNFLIPQGFAAPATKSTILKYQARDNRHEKKKDKLNKYAKRLPKENIVFELPADETGSLFGGVSNKMILDELQSSYPLLEQKMIIIDTPIKNLGEFFISIRLQPKKILQIKITVNKK